MSLANGRDLRLFHYIRHLRQHRFDLLCLGDVGRVEGPIAELMDECVVFSRPYVAAPAGIVGKLGRRLSFSASTLAPVVPEVAQWLRKVDDEGRYDVFWFSGGAEMAVHVPRPSRTAFFADVVDDQCLMQWREVRAARSSADLLRFLKRLFVTWRMERQSLSDADAALFVSDVDAGVFRRICPRVPTYVIPNGVDAEYFSPQPRVHEEYDCVFEGNMAYGPNIDAAVYFVEQIFPRLREAHPDASFCIVGRDPAAEVLALRRVPGVEVTGGVPDVRPYLAGARVFVCPMRSGAGIKNKVLQAWAMAKAVVATPESTGGLTALHGKNILLASDPREFARAIQRLLIDVEERRRLGEAARATIDENFRWEQAATLMERAWLAARVSRGVGVLPE